MVDMIDPKLDEMVLDPACGTGGFLAHVLDHKIDHYVETVEDRVTVRIRSRRRKEGTAAFALHHQYAAARYRDADQYRAR